MPLFSAMDAGALRLMAFAAEPLDFAKGEILFRRGEPANAGFLVVSGAVLLNGSNATPRPARTIGPGALIGKHALLVEVVQPITARAGTETSTLKITRSLFARVLQEYPADAVAIRRTWARELNERLAADQNRSSTTTGT